MRRHRREVIQASEGFLEVRFAWDEVVIRDDEHASVWVVADGGARRVVHGAGASEVRPRPITPEDGSDPALFVPTQHESLVLQADGATPERRDQRDDIRVRHQTASTLVTPRAARVMLW